MRVCFERVTKRFGSHLALREVTLAGARITVSPEQRASLARVPGFAVGVRPEHIRLRPEAAAGWTEARVLVVEPIGNDTIVTLASGDTHVVARAGGDAAPQPGQPLWFAVDHGKTLFFDAGSGTRIT